MSDDPVHEPSFHKGDVEVIARETVFNGFFQMQRVKLRHRLFEGGWSEPVTRELFVRGKAVAAIMYDPFNDLVGFVEQFRIGAYSSEISPWLLEMVAGMAEPDESSREVIIRELLEEANMKPERLLPICEYFSSPGGTSESTELFCALGDLREVAGVYGLAEENEDIRVWVKPATNALNNLYCGQYNNAATLICLQWLAMNRQQLRKKTANHGA